MSTALQGLTAFVMGITSLITAGLGLRAALSSAVQQAAKDAAAARKVAEELVDDVAD